MKEMIDKNTKKKETKKRVIIYNIGNCHIGPLDISIEARHEKLGKRKTAEICEQKREERNENRRLENSMENRSQIKRAVNQRNLIK